MRNLSSFLLGALTSGLCIVGQAAEPAADTIYQGGTIITMNDAQPSTQAVAVKDGKILAIGSTRSSRRVQGRADQSRKPRWQDNDAGLRRSARSLHLRA